MKQIISLIIFLLIPLSILTGCTNASKSPFEVQEVSTLENIGSKQGSIFIFTQSDLKTREGQKTIGLYVPLKFNQEITGITQNLDCTITKNDEDYLAIFNIIKETDRIINSINDEFNLRADILFGSNDRSVVLNTGSSTGTRQEGIKIMKAPKKSNAGVYYYFTNDLGGDLKLACKINIISENPIFSASEEFTITYYKVSSADNNTDKRSIIELNNIRIGHGTVLPSGEIQFLSKDLVIGDRIYSANVDLEISVNQELQDVHFDLQCIDSSTEENSIPQLKEVNNLFEFSEPDFDIDGRVTLSGSSEVIFNSGSSQGTKIIKAENGDSLLVTLQFNFGELESSKSMNCKALFNSDKNKEALSIPLKIAYIK